MAMLFTEGPFDTLTEHTGRIVVTTDVPRLLKWGQTPFAPNDRNLAEIVESIKHLSQRSAWYGMEADAVLRLRSWAEGLKLASRYAAKMPDIQMQKIGRRPVWAEDGDEFDRDRWDAGHEQCWRTRRRTTIATRPILKLTCAIGGSGSLGPHKLAWMGAAAFAIVDAAEAAGYRVEVEAISHVKDAFTNTGRTLAQRVRVKAAEDPLDRETTVMALSCPAFFRWHVMHSRNAVSADLLINDCYGVTRDIPTDLQGDLHMPHAYAESDAAGEVGRLIRQIEDLNGTIAA